MTARKAKRTPTPKATGTALRTTPGGRASATPKNQCRRPRTGRGDDGASVHLPSPHRRPPAGAEAIAPRLVPHRPAQQRPPQGQRRSAGKNFRRRRFATLAHTPRRPQAAGATPSRRASMRRGPGSAGFKIEAAPKTERKRAGFERPATSGALATRGRRIDLARAICGNFSQSSFTLLSK